MTNEEFIKSVSLTDEEWRDVVGYEGIYMVSSFGRVFSFHTSNLMKPYLNKHGYYSVNLRKNNSPKTVRVHRVMCIAFLPNPENLPSIDHIDGNKQNNKLTNLKWCSCKENSNNHNTIKKMSISAKKRCSEGRMKHSPVVAINIKDEQDIMFFNIMSHACKYGFDSGSITKCCKGILHKHKGYKWMYLSDYEALINLSKNEAKPTQSNYQQPQPPQLQELQLPLQFEP